MSDIAKLYEEVMSSGTDKTAADVNADGGPAFDKSFFQKVASGEEEAVQALNEFIEEAKAEGHSEAEIEEAIGQAMVEAGVETQGAEGGDAGDDEYELQKAAAYAEGAQKAVEDVLGSELAKEAGVTAEDLVEFELGGHFGTGYAETRKVAEEVVAKIAAAKKAEAEKTAGMGSKAKELGRKLLAKLKAGAGKAKSGASAAAAKGKEVVKNHPGKAGLAAGLGVGAGLGAAALAAKKKK